MVGAAQHCYLEHSISIYHMDKIHYVGGRGRGEGLIVPTAYECRQNIAMCQIIFS